MKLKDIINALFVDSVLFCFSTTCSLFTISVIKLRNDRVPMMQQPQHRPRQEYINITVHDRLFSCFAFYLIEYAIAKQETNAEINPTPVLWSPICKCNRQTTGTYLI